MKEWYKPKSHISSKLRTIYVSSNNGRHPVAKNFTIKWAHIFQVMNWEKTVVLYVG